MALPALFPLALYRGDTYRYEFRLWQDAAKTLPVDLTGAVAKAEIRNQPSGALVVAFTCTVTLPNTVAVVLAAEASRLVPPQGVWDLQLTYLNGDVSTILAGPVTLRPDVTDSTGVPDTDPLRVASGF